MKESEKGERRPRCIKRDICHGVWLTEETKTPQGNLAED